MFARSTFATPDMIAQLNLPASASKLVEGFTRTTFGRNLRPQRSIAAGTIGFAVPNQSAYAGLQNCRQSSFTNPD
jgi:hypothetical protein